MKSNIGLDRINSYFDHEYPNFTENGSVLIYSGDRGPTCSHVRQTGYYCYDGHDGIDYQATEGTTVLSSHDGLATGTKWACRSGQPKTINVITIVKGRYQTVYLHVLEDDFWKALRDAPRLVRAGERIASVSNTGYPNCSGGPHLHFGIYFDANENGSFESNELVDPYGFKSLTSEPDPWSKRGGPTSSWLWDDDKQAQTLVNAQLSTILASNFATVTLLAGTLLQPAVLGITAVEDPNYQSISSLKALNSSVPFIDHTVSVGTSFELTGVYTDGTPVIQMSRPVTMSISLAKLDIATVYTQTLAIYLWNKTSSQWQPITSTLNWPSLQVEASVFQPGTYNVRGQPLLNAPIITSIAPSIVSNAFEQMLTIDGSGFQDSPWITLGYTALEVKQVSAVQLRVIVPPQITSGTYLLKIRNPDGQTATYQLPITVTASIFLPTVIRL